jgi:hypothetical protein
MVGIDAREYVLNMGLETAGSLILRRGAKGQVVSQRQAVSQPVVGLDEFGRAKPEAVRIAKALLYGDLETPFENEMVEIRCVPIVMMNPKTSKRNAELTELLGLDEGTIRRSTIADLSRLEIPENVLTEGDRLLDRARALGPAEFPPPRHPDWRPTAEVKRLLLVALDRPARLAEIDVTMVALLCAGLTSWLSREDALRLGVTKYLEVVETLDWLKRDWRTSVARALEEAGQLGADTGTRGDETTRNPRDYSVKIDDMLSACRDLGVTPEKGASLLGEVRTMGLERLRRLRALDQRLEDAGLDVEDITSLHESALGLAQAMGTSDRRAVALTREIVRTLARTLPPGAEKKQLRAAVASIAATGADAGRLRRRIAEQRGLLAELEERHSRDQAAADLCRQEREQAEKDTNEVKERLADLREELRALEEECRTRIDEIERGREIVMLLASELALDGPFARQLQRELHNRRIRKQRREFVPLSQASEQDLTALFVRRLNPRIFYVDQVQIAVAEAYRQAVRELGNEFQEILESLRASDHPDSRKIKIAEDTLLQLRIRELQTWVG